MKNIVLMKCVFVASGILFFFIGGSFNENIAYSNKANDNDSNCKIYVGGTLNSRNVTVETTIVACVAAIQVATPTTVAAVEVQF